MSLSKTHKVSPLGKTWIFDLDGTLVKHNGYKIDGKDSWLEGALEYLQSIPETDMIVFLTSRKYDECGIETESFLKEHNVKYAQIIWNAPYGERILVNDEKPSGLKTSVAINTQRDVFMKDTFEVDESL